MKIKVIACGIFEKELEHLKGSASTELELCVLDAGLHAEPHKLRLLAQEEIDKAEGKGFDGIALLYGLCGRGISGLITHTVPLALPRVHDCIGMFLGSQQAYRKEFAEHPGTRYMTPGWFEKKAYAKRPETIDHFTNFFRGDAVKGHPLFSELADKYGEQNAREIIFFHESWKKNYTRIALTTWSFRTCIVS